MTQIHIARARCTNDVAVTPVFNHLEKIGNACHAVTVEVTTTWPGAIPDITVAGPEDHVAGGMSAVVSAETTVFNHHGPRVRTDSTTSISGVGSEMTVMNGYVAEVNMQTAAADVGTIARTVHILENTIIVVESYTTTGGIGDIHVEGAILKIRHSPEGSGITTTKGIG